MSVTDPQPFPHLVIETSLLKINWTRATILRQNNLLINTKQPITVFNPYSYLTRLPSTIREYYWSLLLSVDLISLMASCTVMPIMIKRAQLKCVKFKINWKSLLAARLTNKDATRLVYSSFRNWRIQNFISIKGIPAPAFSIQPP